MYATLMDREDFEDEDVDQYQQYKDKYDDMQKYYKSWRAAKNSLEDLHR